MKLINIDHWFNSARLCRREILLALPSPNPSPHHCLPCAYRLWSPSPIYHLWPLLVLRPIGCLGCWSISWSNRRGQATKGRCRCLMLHAQQGKRETGDRVRKEQQKRLGLLKFLEFLSTQSSRVQTVVPIYKAIISLLVWYEVGNWRFWYSFLYSNLIFKTGNGWCIIRLWALIQSFYRFYLSNGFGFTRFCYSVPNFILVLLDWAIFAIKIPAINS